MAGGGCTNRRSTSTTCRARPGRHEGEHTLRAQTRRPDRPVPVPATSPRLRGSAVADQRAYVALHDVPGTGLIHRFGRTGGPVPGLRRARHPAPVVVGAVRLDIPAVVAVMPWVKRVNGAVWGRHSCPRPTTDPYYPHPAGPPAPTYPNGELGDVWRCPGCRRLWRIAPACAPCDLFGFVGGHRYGGQHMVGTSWRPATLAQRLRHWRPLRG